jgi:hypothetical protein
MLADELLQPVLHSYTVDSLLDMAASCNLELLLPCLNQFDKEVGAFSWNLTFNDPVVKELYESLPDTRRWQITNLLLLDNSPMLWFYLQRADAGRPRKPERQVCEEFLNTVFTPARARQSNFICDEHGEYKRSPKELSYPVAPPEALVRPIFNAVDGRSTMREIFARLGLETTFGYVNLARLKLTTPAFPYLKATRHGAPVGTADVNLSEIDTRRLAADKFEKFKGIKPKLIQSPRQD